jgi:transposase
MLPAGTALLAEDETDVLLFPSLRAGWAHRGEAAPVLISGHNARRTVFGCLHLRTGHFLCLEQAHKRAENFQEFLDFIREHYRKGPLALLLDENPSHKDEDSRSLAEDLDIQLLWLPKRSPHLNPMDHLWGHGKTAVCANYQHDSIEEQVAQLRNYYDDLSPSELLRKAGMCSPDFWLSGL